MITSALLNQIKIIEYWIQSKRKSKHWITASYSATGHCYVLFTNILRASHIYTCKREYLEEENRILSLKEHNIYSEWQNHTHKGITSYTEHEANTEKCLTGNPVRVISQRKEGKMILWEKKVWWDKRKSF